MTTKTLKWIGKTLLISVIIYTLVCLVLIYWPIEIEKNVMNYDYNSINTNTEVSLGTEQWVKMEDGKEIFSRVYESDSKNVVILIHGSGSDSRYLANLANAIADQNIGTVITPDMRGHGRNNGDRGDIDYIGQLDDDINKFIHFSKKELNAEKVILAGHSSGGGFVLNFIGNQKNSKVDKAILIAPFLGYKAPTVKPNSGGWVQVALKRIIGLSMLNNLHVKALNHLPVLFFNLPDNLNDSLQVQSYSYNMIMNFDSKDYQQEIKNTNIPCLVVVGDEDESFYPEQFPIVFEPARNLFQVEIIEKLKHLDIVKNDKVFELIKEWDLKN
ncbi:alpha/beta hydrolase [Marinigracilibium pacificum]|uniref:Alpha/beta hydrolase n=1 Tax=Marinigracilibium pacificum TaxID=2729599 RepID=A0A848IUW3_9BACT|nr:alpha/beta fold hydrolase [Marinigracilibium pacificum]NMM48127.1 alpha/beta hydrolase [Marinigracilibium pacificum]